MSKKPAIKNPSLFLCITLAFGYFFIQNVRAETLPIKSYTTSDGLAHDRVNRIVKDSRGFLWFCTSEGLSRFDGYEFKNYTQDDGLPHRAVYDFLETRGGELWIATGDGVVLFDPLGNSSRESQNAQFAPMFRAFCPTDLKAEVKTFSVGDLLEDGNGKVWAASSTGVYQLEKQADWSLRRFDIPAATKSEDFSNLLEDGSGAIWAGAEVGLFRISADGSGVRTINEKMRVESLLADREGRVWVGSAGGGEDEAGLHLFSITDNEPRRIRGFRKRDGLSDDLWMNSLLETGDGRIFVGVANGLCEYTPQADSSGAQFRVLSDEKVVALGEDASGNVWFSTNSSGVRRLARHGFVNFDKSDGLESTKIESIISTSDGEVYILADRFKINRFNGEGFDTVAPRGMIQGNWGTGQITFPDRAGAWWVAGVTGLQRYPGVKKLEDLATTKALKTYTTADGLVSNNAFQLFEDSRGDIWISVIGIENSIHRWERAADRIRAYTTEDGLPPRNGAVTYGEDRAGNVWLGFYYGGLYRYRNGKFESFSAEDGLPSGLIGNIFTDSKGRVWAATGSGGVVRIDNPTEEKPRLKILTTRDGLSSNQATCTTEDNFGRIYISTGRGVNRLDLQTGRVKIFTKADGLPENIVRLCQRDSSGALWFGTAEGLSRYVPVAEERSAPAPIFLSNLSVNGEMIKKLSELGETNVENLDFASDQRQIQIDFFAPAFTTGESLRYQYRLDGIDADWSEPTALRTVNLNLSAGKYRFLVRAVNSEGAASEQPATVSFSIARPVWQRWWFLILAALLIGLLIYSLYRYRLRRLLELERVRTRIATDLHDDIGASLSKIAILSEIVNYQMPENAEVEKSLTEITGTSREMVASMSDIVWAINPERDSLSDLTGRMRNLASEMAELTDINLRFHLSGVEAEGDLPLGADLRREIYLIFKETVNNLVKHSACRSAEIEFRLERDKFVFIVKDDGKGFDATGNNNRATRGGNGLINMRQRAESLGGNYKIESGAGKGTSVTLWVPLKTKFQGLGLKRFLRG